MVVDQIPISPDRVPFLGDVPFSPLNASSKYHMRFELSLFPTATDYHSDDSHESVFLTLLHM